MKNILSFKNYLHITLVAFVCLVLISGCVKRGYQDKEWSTFDFSAQTWLDNARSQQGDQAFTFELPTKLDFTQHGRTKDKAHFTFTHFETAKTDNPAAPHIGISGVVQGDKLGLLVYYSTRVADSENNAPNTVQNLYALLYSVLPDNTSSELIRSTIADAMQSAKQSTFLTAQRKIDDVNISIKYGKIKLENTELEEDQLIDSVMVSLCRGDDCK